MYLDKENFLRVLEQVKIHANEYFQVHESWMFKRPHGYENDKISIKFDEDSLKNIEESITCYAKKRRHSDDWDVYSATITWEELKLTRQQYRKLLEDVQAEKERLRKIDKRREEERIHQEQQAYLRWKDEREFELFKELYEKYKHTI